MANSEHAPKARFCSGACSASVYENATADGKVYFSVKLSKSYVDKKTNERKYTDSFSVSELPDLIAALDRIVQEFRVRKFDNAASRGNAALPTLEEQGNVQTVAGFDESGLY